MGAMKIGRTPAASPENAQAGHRADPAPGWVGRLGIPWWREDRMTNNAFRYPQLERLWRMARDQGRQGLKSSTVDTCHAGAQTRKMTKPW